MSELRLGLRSGSDIERCINRNPNYRYYLHVTDKEGEENEAADGKCDGENDLAGISTSYKTLPKCAEILQTPPQAVTIFGEKLVRCNHTGRQCQGVYSEIEGRIVAFG